jgi:hypothetical protein
MEDTEQMSGQPMHNLVDYQKSSLFTIRYRSPYTEISKLASCNYKIVIPSSDQNFVTVSYAPTYEIDVEKIVTVWKYTENMYADIICSVLIPPSPFPVYKQYHFLRVFPLLIGETKYLLSSSENTRVTISYGFSKFNRVYGEQCFV